MQKSLAVNIIVEKKLQGDADYYKADNGKKFAENYKNKIIIVRNNLAHCNSVLEDEKEVLKTRTGDKVFTEEDFVTIRKNISSYRQLFEKLLS